MSTRSRCPIARKSCVRKCSTGCGRCTIGRLALGAISNTPTFSMPLPLDPIDYLLGRGNIVEPLRASHIVLASHERNPERIAVALINVLDRLALVRPVCRYFVEMGRLMSRIEAVTPSKRVAIAVVGHIGSGAEGHYLKRIRFYFLAVEFVLSQLPCPFQFIHQHLIAVILRRVQP